MSIVPRASVMAQNGLAGRLLMGSAIVCGLLLNSPVIAQGLNWVNIGRQTPMSQFNEKDVDLFIETGTAALDDDADGVEKIWKNADSGNSGSITAARTFTQDGLRCRTTVIENRSRSYFSRSTHSFCRNTDGRWMWVPPPR